MHPLYYVATVVEHSPNILRVYRTGKVWIAVMFPIARSSAYSLLCGGAREFQGMLVIIFGHITTYATYQKFISNEIFCSNKIGRFTWVEYSCG